MAAGKALKPDHPSAQVLGRIATGHQATTAQLMLAWLLQRSPVILPIPGTSSIAHLEENVAAAGLQLSAEEWRDVESAFQTK
jgi:pyridoxine 4-dehydrogenase